MPEVVIVEAVRSAVGKRNGGLSHYPAPDLFADVLAGLIDRAGIDSALVGQVTGGCVSQVGQQSGNITRSAWLAAGLDQGVGACTVHAQCGSSQQAFTLAYGLVAAGVVDVAVAGGVESMSQVPMTASLVPELGRSKSARYERRYEITTQFEAADRIAGAWGFTRDQLEEFAVMSQQRAAAAIEQGRFATQIVPVKAPVADSDGKVTGTATVAVDEGPRPTTRDGLAALKVNLKDRPGALHTAGTSSQISDGASALLIMAAERSAALSVRPRARVVDSVLVGSDPVMMLTGPINATAQILERNNLTLDDLDVIEVNEAFASVVLAWAHEMKSDLSNVNVNGGAIALGHPLGATGGVLLTKCLGELERTGGRYGLVTMCVGGGMGTGTLIERI
ncbi:acetyl-CoA C-acyltransferase [Mycobacterium branderi]|uniref:Acetyl-CoA acetyltransferase n=1 Tax=Mycobacterium branderi TaxID=43348 RepID=A0ABM7KUU9_9MYCO|nr:acetyl-CoA C-acyltransferase [Mycobacterium branderi]MCV7231610.1 acetyl-CoA C-acyltransferase [Mycobacterium branderi]BBZ14907.1 acetyl-CoA acetyltransferase [Mycobacterium branderi]